MTAAAAAGNKETLLLAADVPMRQCVPM